MPNFKLIIGVVGPLGSGKSILVDYLVGNGFAAFRFSDVIVKIGDLKNSSRKDYQDWGDRLRKKYGTDFLAREIWKKIEKLRSEKYIIDGFRNIGEVEFFGKKKGFYLISLNSTRKIRFERLKKRGSSKDPKSWDEFMKMERRDLGEKEFWGQQNKTVMKLADIKIKNNSSIKELHSKIDSVLKSLYEFSRKNSG